MLCWFVSMGLLGNDTQWDVLETLLSVAAIVLAAMAARSLKEYNIEDGQGSALAGLIIGALGLIAQGAYVVYVVKSGKLPFLG